MRDGSKFFSLKLDYGATYEQIRRIRTHIRLEVRFVSPQMPVIYQPVQSLLGLTEGKNAEIASMPFINPVEIAADKLSALSWRLLDEKEKQDEPLIRHVHDLAALEPLVAEHESFPDLVRQSILADQSRSELSEEQQLDGIIAALQTPAWENAYQLFVTDMSFARDDELIAYGKALEACERLIKLIRH